MRDGDRFGGPRTSLQDDAIFESLARRARPGERPEELTFDLGLVAESEYALELAAKAGFPYAGLREFMPDARLFVYLPLAIATRERVCPLLLVGDALKLASAYADPDLSYLERRFPHLRVDLTISPRSEILAALDRFSKTL